MGMLGWLSIIVVGVGVKLASMYAKAPLPIHPVDLNGRVMVVTGASAGIGKETARILAAWNATVIMACRNEEKAAGVLEDIKATTKSDKVEVWKLDLASFASVKAFAERYIASGLPLHVLINNAGLISNSKVLTEDGHELTHQVNHLGHFLLTRLLEGRLRESAPARVVQVSSDAYMMGKIDLDNLDAEKDYGWSLNVYSNSKLMNVLFANELTRKWEGSGVVSTSLHPGFVETEFLRDLPQWAVPLLRPIWSLFARNEYEGALTTIWAATHPSLEGQGGVFLDSCKVLAQRNPLAVNETLAAQFWDVSEKAVAGFLH